ncbi:hypothetical protein P152DRAFT_446765 [Eremomyces bilateralis CBS 781.70]|uniref:Uncharacterized protein n=1 Tax=Eremomyces bilateralis CBS 781.70 TaxID=1392243 RepID=A0A6G1GCV6_9PEZI|nr:uncharacterized protein P152DRAFT_446765 [Eremomyces bilateralis CBS 781.70]KAF1815736.1 hypothetical protein P152DRAFT_446765 [Eremomyces bilateralis CBS 781.70]
MDGSERRSFRPTVSHKRPRTENYSSPFSDYRDNNDEAESNGGPPLSSPPQRSYGYPYMGFDLPTTPVRHRPSSPSNEHTSEEEGSDMSDDTLMSDFSLHEEGLGTIENASDTEHWPWSDPLNEDFAFLDPEVEDEIENMRRQGDPLAYALALDRANEHEQAPPIIDLTSDNDRGNAMQRNRNQLGQSSSSPLTTTNNDRNTRNIITMGSHQQDGSRNPFDPPHHSNNSNTSAAGEEYVLPSSSNRPLDTLGFRPTAAFEARTNHTSYNPVTGETMHYSAQPSGPSNPPTQERWFSHPGRPNTSMQEIAGPSSSEGRPFIPPVDLTRSSPLFTPGTNFAELARNNRHGGRRPDSDQTAPERRFARGPTYTLGSDNIVDLTDDITEHQATAGASTNHHAHPASSPEVQFIAQRHRVPPPPHHRTAMTDPEISLEMEIIRSTGPGPIRAEAVHTRDPRNNSVMAVFRPMFGSLVSRHLPDAFEAPDLNFATVGFDLRGEGRQREATASPGYAAPGPAPEGFTRSPEEGEELVCPNCGKELCAGVEGDRKQVWVVKGCGHVYCGLCAKSRSKSGRGKGKKNAAGLPPPFKSCVVEGCGKQCSNKTQMVQLFL